MAGNWMDDRERQIRERDARGLGDVRRDGGEDRSWGREEHPGPYSARRSGPNRDPVFGEGQSGASYGPASAGGGYRGGSASGGWQNPNYGGVSPAMRQGGYGQGGRLGSQDYTGGGRFYGDDDRERIYREEYGQGGAEYAETPRGYDAQRSPTRERYPAEGYGQPGFGGYPGEHRQPMTRPLSGGTGYGQPGSGGYPDEYGQPMTRPLSGGTGYGDGGRRESRADRFEDVGRGAGEFLHRAGERVAAWFGGGGEARAYDPIYDQPSRGARGLGPQGYKRSDERISDDAHERLTDDLWLDASNIAVSVSGGEVTLSGTVETREAKHHAERIVEDISGVNHVQNNLRVAKGGFLTSPGSGDSVLGAQLRRDAPAAGGTGGGQSTAGKKN